MAAQASPMREGGVELRVEDLRKAYGETRALVGVQMTAHGGRILCIVGENGSGKSTLVKILSGVLEQDAGSVRLNGQSVRPRSPAEAQRLGVATVYQEILNTPNQTVWDNLALGTSSPDLTPSRARELLAHLTSTRLELGDVVGELPLSSQQIVAIARAILRRPSVLILDEPTSALGPDEVRNFLNVVRAERARGTAVIFISHRFDEVLDLGDEILIIRSGASVAEMSRAEATAGEVLRLMSGGKRLEEASRHARNAGRQTVRIVAEGVRTWAGRRPVSLEVRAGELLGIAGLEGHGQERFLLRLAGFGLTDNGQVRVATDQGGDVAIRSQDDARRAGVAYVPRDRKTEGLFLPLPILDNFAVASFSRFVSAVGVLSRTSEMRAFRRFADSLKLHYGDAQDAVSSLSGGNQQKVILARWLATEPRVMILNDPTRGVDIPTKEDLYELLHRACADGMSVVFLSTDIVELCNHTDRVAVFREGEVTATLGGDDLRPERILAAMFGEVG